MYQQMNGLIMIGSFTERPNHNKIIFATGDATGLYCWYLKGKWEVVNGE
ncbi:hypothetical protein [Foetidibacter luteolus]|nr:hypothetical protein [Foetidibacter luteolus]